MEDGYRALRGRLEGNETVLLKASRGVALESLVDRFEQDFGQDLGGHLAPGEGTIASDAEG